MKIKLSLVVLCAGLALAATTANAKPLRVVASFTILADLTKQIGGEHVAVTSLLGVDSDAHVFQPTPNDAKSLKEADIIIINGLGFEGWMSRLIQSADAKAPVVIASADIPKVLKMEEHEEEHHHAGHHHEEDADGAISDPHAWQSITNGRVYARNIAAALQKADPKQSDYYAKRAAALDASLAALDVWVKNEIATIPVEKRSVITTHDAFGYFADAYQVKFLAPTGFSTEDEPSAKELKHLVKQINSGKTRALFFENMSNPNVIKQLAKETGAVVGSSLYADALSSQDGNAATYQAMFKYNVTALVKAMQQNK
jgi:zinc/manganese transport system substrate-binding protein